jgi:YegS/Rv2252/BmrU family lipid kinase
VRVAFILNPAAGQAKPGLQEQLRAAALAAGLSGPIVRTEAPGHATQLARELASRGVAVVVAVGGDGTAGEAAAGLLGSGAALAVLPTGSGNDFAREIGLPRSWRPALAVLAQARRRRIDVGRVNGTPFLQSAGAGLDGHVARIQAHGRRLPGPLAHATRAIQGLLTYAPQEVSFELDGRRWRQRVLAVTVANGAMYGGGMRIAPGARLDDGVLDVAVIGDLGKLDALRMFPTVYWGGHVRHPKFRLLRGRSLRLDSAVPLPVQVDGNARGETPAEFSVEPAALEVLSLR